MQCPQCAFDNRDDARFCKRCGRELLAVAPAARPSVTPLCSACGATLKPGARFCARCGQPLAAQVAPQPAFQPARPPAAPAPTPAASEALPQPRTERGATRRLLALVAAGLAFCMACCGIFGLALLPALSEAAPAALAGGPTGHDLTIMVRESYLNKSVAAILPDKGLQGATLDVQPGNRIVTTANFDVLFISLELKIVARIAVVDGEIQVSIEEIQTGGRNLLEFLGMDNVTVGENFTRMLREQLENELGEGAQLLDITTDEEHIILKARL